MTETEVNNWQIRINVFGNTNHTIEIVEAIEKLKLGYDIRLLNIDKDEGEVDDETQNKCHSCGRMDSSLHQYVCDACLLLEKEERQQEHDTKYDNGKRGTEWDYVSRCTNCGEPTKYESIECYWHCIGDKCDNTLIDTTANANGFDASKETIEELKELKKEHSHAEWI